jgi:peptidyl-prolyl cis-trans isomerase C
LLLNKWLREPLLHFLVIGGLLFVFYSLLNDEVNKNDNRIVITTNDINRLSTQWKKQWKRLPTQIELKGLIEHYIREEVMYREALVLGLDKNDFIVRRRLAQKLEFISSDLASLAEPADAELADFLITHQDKFTQPSKLSFKHIYLNTDKRGAQAQKDAQNLLNKLTSFNSIVDFNALGDPFMLGQQYEHVTEQEVSRIFGNTFATKLFALPIGSWQGPVESGYGIHLVQIDTKTTSSQPQLNSVYDKVRAEWFVQQRSQMDEVFYKSLRKRYEIKIKDGIAKNAVASPVQ